MLVFEVRFTQSIFQDLLERCKGVDDKIQPRNPELKLHTDQCISYIGKNLPKDNNTRYHLKVSLELR